MFEENFDYILSSGPTVHFKLDKNIPTNCVYWDTIKTHKEQKEFLSNFTSTGLNLQLINFSFSIYYNVSDNNVIKSVTKNLNTIYDNYINSTRSLDSGSFVTLPSPNSSIPAWATYNPELKLFSFDIKLIFNVETDVSKISQCVYFNKPSFPDHFSDHYQYANASMNYICSNPIFSNNLTKPYYCQYSSDIVNITSCSGYQANEAHISTHVLTHKTSNNSFELKTVLKCSVKYIYSVSVINSLDNSVLSTLSYDSIAVPKDKTLLYEEIFLHLDSLLNSYLEDYNVETTFNILFSSSSVSVKIKSKSSYISNLIPKDDYVNQNQVYQTV